MAHDNVALAPDATQVQFAPEFGFSKTMGGDNMPVDLHQRLSEFSYGYGVTREVEQLLAGVGIRATPFLPSLVAEKKLGFDVKFDKPGVVLLLQFKLGEVLQRFRKPNSSAHVPKLDKPFWRFSVDTAETAGQYDLLLKSQQAGAETYYVAPRFSAWDEYALLFQGGNVLQQSLLLPPIQINAKLAATGEPDGLHRVVYDNSSVHVLSEPKEVEEVKAVELPSLLRTRIIDRGQRVGDALRAAYASLERSRAIRRPADAELPDLEQVAEIVPSPQRLAAERSRRLEQFRATARSEQDALFAAVGVEAWAVGSQLLAATLAD